MWLNQDFVLSRAHVLNLELNSLFLYIFLVKKAASGAIKIWSIRLISLLWAVVTTAESLVLLEGWKKRLTKEEQLLCFDLFEGKHMNINK